MQDFESLIQELFSVKQDQHFNISCFHSSFT
jgi:hypothetical protein